MLQAWLRAKGLEFRFYCRTRLRGSKGCWNLELYCRTRLRGAKGWFKVGAGKKEPEETRYCSDYVALSISVLATLTCMRNGVWLHLYEFMVACSYGSKGILAESDEAQPAQVVA